MLQWTRFPSDRRPPCFVRPLDLYRDALHVGSDEWEDFHEEPFRRESQPDIEDRNFGVRNELRCLAVDLELHYFSVTPATWFDSFQHWFHHIQVSLIIVNGGIRRRGHMYPNTVNRSRYEFAGAQRGDFFRDKESAFRFVAGEQGRCSHGGRWIRQ